LQLTSDYISGQAGENTNSFRGEGCYYDRAGVLDEGKDMQIKLIKCEEEVEQPCCELLLVAGRWVPVTGNRRLGTSADLLLNCS
jgi:hypothetical protein